MNRQQAQRAVDAALKEAQKRWGKTAHVSFDLPLNYADVAKWFASAEKAELKRVSKVPLSQRIANRMPSLERIEHGHASVGVIMLGMFFEVRGSGNTFADAFLDYDWGRALDDNKRFDEECFLRLLKEAPKSRCVCKEGVWMHSEHYQGVTPHAEHRSPTGKSIYVGECLRPGCDCKMFRPAPLKPVDPAVREKRLAALEKARAAKAAARPGGER